MRIIIDAMGGDNAPGAIVCGAIGSALAFPYLEITLVGIESEIKKHIDKLPDNVRIVHTDEYIKSDDIPTQAIKEKKNSSLLVGLRLVKDGKGDAFLSAGNTGALLAGSITTLGRIKGVKRPALTPLMPTKNGASMLIDVGANLECKPINLLQFGIMGYIYMRKVMNIENPRVGLINIGTEEGKGPELYKEAYDLLKDANINFIGNVETRQIPYGDADVFVCDGFVGNAVLKMMEGAGLLIMSMLKDIFMKDTKGKLAAVLIKSGLGDFKARLDYKEYGGAPLLGIDGVVMKAHGSSDAHAISSAIKAIERFAKTKVNDEIEKTMSKGKNKEDEE